LSATPAPPNAVPDRRQARDERHARLAWHRRLFTLAGVLPLGVFVPAHLLTTATATQGGARFDRTFAHSTGTTGVLLLVVVLPLAFHAAYGAWLALARPAAANLPSWLPRIRSGASLATLVFVVGHLLELPLRTYAGALRVSSLEDTVAAHLSSTWHGVPLIALGYLIGVAATIAHFSLSIWALVPSYGLVLTERGRATLAWGLGAGAIGLFLVGANTIVYLATGTRVFGPTPDVAAPDGPPAPACSPKS
jgi:succinate dehydrogenase / fumarate reductase cytochrome b subunit